jgi:hypothetical protein
MTILIKESILQEPAGAQSDGKSNSDPTGAAPPL